MRTAVFVIVGLVLGLVAAQRRGRTHPTAVDTVAIRSGNRATPRSSPALALSERRLGVSQRDIAPTDPRYDAFELSREDDEMAFKDIFERESRDLAFAPVMEKRIHDALHLVFHELQLEARVRAMHTSCRTLSCLTTIEVAKAEGEQVYNEINGILLGDGQNPELVDSPDAALSEIKIYNIYRAQTRDEGYYKQFLDEAMRPALESSKLRYLNEKPNAQDDAAR
jgi:hypothetical protein